MNTGGPCRSMRARRSIFAAVVLFVALGVGPAGYAQTLLRARPGAVGLSAERLKRLSDALHGYVREGRLPGVGALELPPALWRR